MPSVSHHPFEYAIHIFLDHTPNTDILFQEICCEVNDLVAEESFWSKLQHAYGAVQHQ